MILLSVALLAAAPATCPTLRLTPVERHADSVAIRQVHSQLVQPGEISEVMAGGRWKAVWATPADAERGVYFLRRDARGHWRSIDVWGGVIAREERRETVAWAMARGRDFPALLARCFVDALIAGK